MRCATVSFEVPMHDWITVLKLCCPFANAAHVRLHIRTSTLDASAAVRAVTSSHRERARTSQLSTHPLRGDHYHCCMQWLEYHKGLGVGRVYVIDHLSDVSPPVQALDAGVPRPGPGP